jgi:predicted metal-dependent HD superfamily phosphohydrolase
MNPSSTELLQQVAAQASIIIETRVGAGYHFHSLQHTQHVVKACEEIGGHYQLADDDMLALLIAAWFHDTGYSTGTAINHEANSISIAREFLTQRGVDEALLTKVTGCIAATRMPQHPNNQLEEIICDADLYHLGTEEASKQSKALRQEINFTKNVHISKSDWARTNIYFMQQHHYFTAYAKEKLGPVKQDNIKRLRKKYDIREEVVTLPDKLAAYKKEALDSDNGSDHTPAPPPPVTNIKTKRDKDKDKEKEKDKLPRPMRPERGIETMFRTTSSNNFRLSSMADSKAHIMISVNAIIISIVGSRLLEKLQNFPHFIIPTIILTLVCLGAIIFAVLATRPNVSKGRFSREDIENKKTNLLFFGNFHEMGVDDYEWAMKEMMKDGEYLYGSMIRDIYFLGVVLARKYKLLRISYNVFMYGLVVSTLAFLVASFFVPKH